MGCRLKKVQGKKKERKAIAEQEMVTEQLPEEFEDSGNGGGGDLLSTKDEDVIF